MDPVKLSAFGLTPQDVKMALDKENVELPSGKIAGNTTELTLNTVGRLKTEEEFNNLILKNEGDRVIRFKDIGTATLGAENEETSGLRIMFTLPLAKEDSHAENSDR